MIIKIDFYQKIDRSEVFARLTNAKGLWRKAVIAAFDLLGDNETGGIFRDDYEYTNDEASYGYRVPR